MVDQTRGPNEVLPTPSAEAQEENKLIAERRAKLTALRDKGIAFPNDFRRDAYAGELQAKYAAATAEELEAQAVPVVVAGRMLAKRVMGKASFATIADPTGRIQLFLQSAALPDAYDAFKGWDVGDTLGAAGTLFRTRTGELSVKVTSLRLLVKSLRPLPDKWHGLADVDTRYRQRYVDLIVNDDSRKVFEARTRIVRALRAVLDGKGFMEVETPMMQPIPGGAAARPFVTHHNSLDMQMYLRIAPELYLKRLVVGGFEKVYEINRNFRNEGLSTRHNPEFTMMELYWAYAAYGDLMDLTEEIVIALADVVQPGVRQLNYQGREYNLARPFARISMADAIVANNQGIDASRLRDVPYPARVVRQDRRQVPYQRWRGQIAGWRSSTTPSSTRCSIPPSSTRTRRRSRRCRAPTMRIPSSPTASSSSSRGVSSPMVSPSSMTRRTRLRASRRRWRARMPATMKPCSTTPTTSARWNTACRPPRAWG